MTDKEIVSMIYNTMFDIHHSCYFKIPSLLGTVKRCEIASELSPEEWPEEILWPSPSPMNKHYFGSIFGNHHNSIWREKTISLIDALVFTELCSSNGEARKSIRNNAVMINRVKCNDISRILTSKDRLSKLDAIVLENGKYNFGIIEMC